MGPEGRAGTTDPGRQVSKPEFPPCRGMAQTAFETKEQPSQLGKDATGQSRQYFDYMLGGSLRCDDSDPHTERRNHT